MLVPYLCSSNITNSPKTHLLKIYLLENQRLTFNPQMVTMASNGQAEAKCFTQASQVGARPQAHGSSSAASLRPLTGSNRDTGGCPFGCQHQASSPSTQGKPVIKHFTSMKTL